MLLLLSYLILPMYTLVSYYVSLARFFPPDLALITIVNAIPGVFLFYWFMNGFITGSRVKKLEMLVGLPRIIRLHILGALGCVLWVIAHFLIKGLPTSMQARFGFFAAVIFILLVLSATIQWINIPLTYLLNHIPFIKKFHLLSHERTQYQDQRRKHNLMACAAVLVYLHIILSGMAETDIVFRILSSAYFLLACSLYLYHKKLRPRVLRKKGHWELRSVKAESDTVTTLVFKPIEKPNGANKGLHYHATQFGFLRFTSGKLAGEEHPFSFTSHPDDEYLSFAIQHDGDYTRSLRDLAVLGDTAVVDGPYGMPYPDPMHEKAPALWIAGGIGIAHFMSLLKGLEQRSPAHAIELFWLNKPESDMFQSDMECFRTIPGLNIKRFSRSANAPLTPEELIAVPDLFTRQIHICASEDLTKGMLAMLRKLGVRKRHIHHQLFSM